MEIIEDDLTGPAMRALLERHARGMLENSPPDACHFLDLSGLQVPEVTVWSIWDDGSLAGCGALREIDGRHGEVKSMRTADDHLGKGVGRKMLEHIVAVARSRGYLRLSLETGNGPSFEAAVHLYRSSGFEPCGPFDQYTESEFSRYLTLDLVDASGPVGSIAAEAPSAVDGGTS